MSLRCSISRSYNKLIDNNCLISRSRIFCYEANVVTHIKRTNNSDIDKTRKQIKMAYPFTWSPVSEEWEAKRQLVYENNSTQLNCEICSPFGISAPSPSKIFIETYLIDIFFTI